MEINKISISNILGIDQMEFKTGKFNLVSGKNGVGKTSILESIKMALGGGNSATLLRNGAKKGEVVLEFDNGEVLKRTVGDSSDFTITDANGKKIKKPVPYLKSLIDLLSVNPVSFLIADSKERAKILLETLKIEVTAEEINAALVGYSNEFLTRNRIDYSSLDDGLEKLNKYRKDVFEERTSVNRILKEKESTIKQLRDNIQEFDIVPELVEAEIAEIEANQKKRLEKKADYVDKINNSLQAELSSIEQMKADAIEKARVKKETLEIEFNANFNPDENKLAVLRENMKQIGAINETLKIISKNEEEVAEYNSNATDLTNSIEELDKIKLSKLENLPIKGLEIQGTDIFINGVPFDRVNEAERIKIAIEIAKLKAGEIGIICLDGLERFDSETFNLFKEEMLKTNLQALVTMVSDNELEIQSE